MRTAAKWISGLFVAVIALFVIAIGLAWESDRSVAELKPRWAPDPSVFISVNGMQVHLRDEGPKTDPEPIVLLHGTSASLHTWDGWAAALIPTRRVIRFDLPGFGLTGPHTAEDYRIEAYVDFVIATLDALNVNQFVLAGNSLGGNIAWSTAVEYPQRVSKLILVDSAGYPYEPEHMPVAFVISQVPLLNRVMEWTLPRKAVTDSVRSVYANPELVDEELVDRYFELSLREGNRRALRLRFAEAQNNNSEAIKNVSQPTLVMWGKEDHLIPPALADRFMEDIANSQLVMLDNLGHVPQEEDPVTTVNAVKSFLN